MTWIYLYIAAAVVATVVGALSTLVFRKLSWKLNFLDVPMDHGHKLHDQATPLLGGAAMIVAWSALTLGGAAAAILLKDQIPAFLAEHVGGMKQMLPQLGVVVGGGIALGVMGLVDDKHPMGWKLKLLLQAVIVGIVTYSPKVQITLFQMDPRVTWFISFCWFLFIINAFNFFDNMDGLAAGVAMIASAIFAGVAAYRGQHFVAGLGAVTAGVTLGYYFFNRFPASIFMGDSGSHFLGYMLAVQGSLTTFYRDAESPTLAPLLIPLIVLSLVIYDTFAVTVVRLRQGRSVFQGDHNHISHRFVRMGFSRPVAVLLVHVLTLALGLGALSLMFLPSSGALIIFMQTGAILGLVSVLHGFNNTEKPEARDVQTEDPDNEG